MDEVNKDTLDLSRRGLKKIEKAQAEESTTIVNLILDQNDLQRLDNIDSYVRVENLSICNNFLLRMHAVSRLTNLRVLALNSNGILQIEGLKDLTFLKVLKLSGNSIKTIEHLNHNTDLEHLDLSNNQISFVADISYLKHLKYLNLERNRVIDLRQCDRYLPPSLEHLALGHNNIEDLNEVSHLVHLNKLESFTMQGNPCLAMAGKERMGFDYRPFVLNWILSVKTIDGCAVSAIESLKAEWLYSQGKGRHYHPGQHSELCEYLATTCPLTALAPETEDQRKLRLILTKAQHHQQQLKDQTHSPVRSRLQSPRMQSRMNPRHGTRSPDRMSSSFHGGGGGGGGSGGKCSPLPAMSASCYGGVGLAGPGVKDEDRNAETPKKIINQSLEAASKMVPVPESLMSPDYQDPIYDIQKSLPKHNSNSLHEDKIPRQIVQPQNINRNMKGSPKLTKSATSSPKLRSKLEQRKGSLTKIDTKEDVKTASKLNGVQREEKNCDDTKASNQRRQKKMSAESSAAVTIQKMWRGYRSRNNKDTLRILHTIQTARARQHIQKLTCDVEATKAALDSERKIQQLQMQAINALWKKVSNLQDSQKNKSSPDVDDNTEVLKQLTETCVNLQSQVVELQGCMREVVRAVTSPRVGGPGTAPVATQTDISALITPQEERCSWLKRPQSLPLPSAASVAPTLHEIDNEHPEISISEDTEIDRTEAPDEDKNLETESTISEIEVQHSNNEESDSKMIERDCNTAQRVDKNEEHCPVEDREVLAE